MNDEVMRSPLESDRKKPYQTPEFRSYGDIREITQNAASMAAVADGAGMFSKTT